MHLLDGWLFTVKGINFLNIVFNSLFPVGLEKRKQWQQIPKYDTIRSNIPLRQGRD